MLLEAEKIRSFARIVYQLIPDRVPRGGIGRWGGWTSGSPAVVAAYLQLWAGRLGWKGVKSALVWAGGGCCSQSRDAPVTVGTSPLHPPLLAWQTGPLSPVTLASPLGKYPCLQHVGPERRHPKAPA